MLLKKVLKKAVHHFSDTTYKLKKENKSLEDGKVILNLKLSKLIFSGNL